MDPFLGEIRMFSGNFAPRGWAFCNGQLMSIAQYSALFSLLGTMYGGDGKATFALPNLQGRSPISFGQGPGLSQRTQGEVGGEPNIQLHTGEVPAHAHAAVASSDASTTSDPTKATWAVGGQTSGGVSLYSAGGGPVAMNRSALTPAGGDQAHNNMQPYLTLNFIIALEGIYPRRS